MKKLYKSSIAKVTKIKNNSNDDIGILHAKKRDLFNSKISIIFTDYTFPKRVKGESGLSKIINNDD